VKFFYDYKKSSNRGEEGGIKGREGSQKRSD
jgi:hypothetical protein